MLTCWRNSQNQLSLVARTMRKPRCPVLQCNPPFVSLPGFAQLVNARCFSAELGWSSSPISVVLLAGFLGAGKTTVLEKLLREQHGFKLGVIVNDLASVNVDTTVLNEAVESSGAPMVSLENGCVCCTIADNLIKSVHMLADAGSEDMDAIVVELSGVAEPARAKQILEAPPEPLRERSRPVSVRTVTVVDCHAFPTDYLREQSDHFHHAHTASGECDERYGVLLAEQVEGADLILLNKADLASKSDLVQTRSMVEAMNESADIRITQYGRVHVTDLLAAAEKGVDNGQSAQLNRNVQDATTCHDPTRQALRSCCVAKTCSSSNENSILSCGSQIVEQTRSRAETRFGITSFVYQTKYLMSYERLSHELEKWQEARARFGDKLSIQDLVSDDMRPSDTLPNMHNALKTASVSPFAPVLRSKGILRLDANPQIRFYWSHAGKSVQLTKLKSHAELDAFQTELVFIGVGCDEVAIRNLLDSCLLLQEE